jgi:hypothetical protein
MRNGDCVSGLLGMAVAVRGFGEKCYMLLKPTPSEHVMTNTYRDWKIREPMFLHRASRGSTASAAC